MFNFNLKKNISNNSIIIGNNISSNNISMSSCNGKTIVKFNGETIEIPSGNISIINNKIYVDGKPYKHESLNKVTIADVTIIGNIEKVDCGGSVTVKGNVTGNIDCGGSVRIEGDHDKGNISCGGSVRIGGRG